MEAKWEHNLVSNDVLEILNIRDASPEFTVSWTLLSDGQVVVCIKMDVDCNFYCSGSVNFEIDKFTVSSCDHSIPLEDVVDYLEKSEDDWRDTFASYPVNVWDCLLDYLQKQVTKKRKK